MAHCRPGHIGNTTARRHELAVRRHFPDSTQRGTNRVRRRIVSYTAIYCKRARENAAVADVDVEWHEGDAESLPFGDGAFDIVLSQFGHMFAPRPEVATREMLRVLKPGGLIAFSTWPPELCIGRIFTLIGRYLPPPPAFAAPPPQWGDPTIVRDRLGAAVTGLVFDRAVMLFPTLTPAHYRLFFEDNAGPVLRLVQTLQGEPPRLAAFRREFDEIATQYFQDNVVRQDYLMTRATKV